MLHTTGKHPLSALPQPLRLHISRPLGPALAGRWRRVAASQQRNASRRHVPPPAAALAAAATSAPAADDDVVLDVHVEFAFTVEGHCSLRAKDRMEDDQRALMTAVIAALLVNLSQRERLLDEAVATARRELPGVLDAEMLKQFDAVKARGDVGTGMALLGFKQLRALCQRIAPEVWHEVQQEIVQAAAQLKVSKRVPIPDDGSGNSNAPKFRETPGFDLPSALVKQARWQGWLKRLRDEVVAWQLEQRKLQKEQQQQQQQSQEAAAAPKGNMVASFDVILSTPGGLNMRQEVCVTVAPPGAKILLNKIRQGFGLFALSSNSSMLIRMSELPETQLRDALKAAAWRHIAVGHSCSFDCTLFPAKQPAGSKGMAAHDAVLSEVPAEGAGSGVAGDAGEAAAHPFEFSASCFDMKMFVLALSWMLGCKEEVSGSGPSSTAVGAWFPSDGRICLQRCVDEWRGGLGGLLRRPGAASAADGEAKYRLRVQPPEQQGSAAATPPQGGAGDAVQQPLEQPGLEEARTTLLSQDQLDALLDCMDAFCHQHPNFVRLPLPEPLLAPPPRLLQGLDSWLRGDEPAPGSDKPAPGSSKLISGSDEPASGSSEPASGSSKLTKEEEQALLAAAKNGTAGGGVTVV